MTIVMKKLIPVKLGKKCPRCDQRMYWHPKRYYRCGACGLEMK